jgi:hypothetical protein
MELQVLRKESTNISTIGSFFINGAFAYNSLELPWSDGANVHKANCILPATYPVIIDYSPHFKRDMPHILNVPDRDEIRIHVGNYPKDTEGCVLIGLSKGHDFIGQSVAAFSDFFAILTNALKSEKVNITIINQF